MRKNRGYLLFAILVLVYNLGVILWGAYGRASGSGAGCGSHWPLCNGEVIPRSLQTETLVEFSHRLTSGLAFILVLVLLVVTFRTFRKGHPARTGAVLAMVFMVTEALVGAGLVLFEWVAHDASIGRIISISVHLINTFLLLASITLTIWWSQTGKQLELRKSSITVWVLLLGWLAVILLGISGAITALGDTLFPSDTLLEGIRQDFLPTAHFLVRLRVWHPVIAILSDAFLFLVSLLMALFFPERKIRTISVP